MLEQAPLVCALWHPLSPSGDCLVTVTQDACIRLWELDSNNRSSFSEPSLALDLKKLANATSNQADFSASKYGTNKGFSPDDVEMAVAAACFGGQGSADEHGWASMTLWLAMTEGDVYALCPFLPSRWRATETTLPSLSTSVMQKVRATTRDADMEEAERRKVEQQRKWLADVDAQDPLLLPAGEEGGDGTAEVYTRPAGLSAVPKLQGPFQLAPEPDFGEITDIYVIARKVDSDALYDDEDDDDEESDEGLSVGVVCLATSTNEVHICLDLDGVEAEWLPTKRSRAYTFDDVEDLKELLLFETIDLAQQGGEDEDNGYPTFTPSPLDRYQLFATHPTGVSGLDLRPWIGMLEDELSGPSDSGAGFRLDVVLDSAHTVVDQPIDIDSANSGINTAIALSCPSLSGPLLLTLSDNTPHSAIISPPHADYHGFEPDSPTQLALPAPEPRAPYRPPPGFDSPSTLPQLIQAAHNNSLLGSAGLSAPLKISPATLQLMTDAHRVLSRETHRLGSAAADLFRRCERMRAELREQVRKVAEVVARVDAVTGEGNWNRGDRNSGRAGDGETDEARRIERRVESARDKTAELGERYERLRRKMGRLGGREMSAKERAFGEEVGRLERSVKPAETSGADDTGEDQEEVAAGTLAGRFDAVLHLKEQLVQQADETVSTPSKEDGGSKAGQGVGNDYRRQKLQQVMALLERETALVEGVQERLGRLARG